MENKDFVSFGWKDIRCFTKSFWRRMKIICKGGSAYIHRSASSKFSYLCSSSLFAAFMHFLFSRL